MRKGNDLDYPLLGITFILILLGILVLASVSASISLEKFKTPFYYLQHQLLWGLIPGVILAWGVFKVRVSFLKKIVPVFILINLVLLAAVFLPIIGSEYTGARRWIIWGPLSFQPSEFLKITFVLYLASWLSSKTKEKYKRNRKKSGPGSPQTKTLFAFLIIIGIISLLLILQPDISTLGVIALTGILMYFLAFTPAWHTLLIILGGLGTLGGLIKIAPYRMNRLTVFLNPNLDPQGIGYQIKQSLIAIGSGGIKGVGLGLSRQKFGYLPGTMSDSIFAIFAEETGVIGSIVLVALFLLFLWRGFTIATRSSDRFLKLTAWGITCWIVIQAFINIGSMSGLLPLTGIPLPFVSYGGSAMITELVGVGLLLKISKYSYS